MNDLIQALFALDPKVVVAALSLVLATRAWLTSIESLRASYRPVVRPVTARYMANDELATETLMLKNYGRGPAIGLTVFDRDEVVIAEVGVLEVMGAPITAGDEKTRIGRVELHLKPGAALKVGTYRIMYQDIGGGWHESRLIIEPLESSVRYLGPKRFWQWRRAIPKLASGRAHVIRRDEN